MKNNMKTIIIKNVGLMAIIGENKNGSKTLRLTGDENMEANDGFHTFDELYEHRITLFIALCREFSDRLRPSEWPSLVWRSKKHSDGELAFGGEWFVLGIGKKVGEQITYHLPISKWGETDFADTLEKAPEYDGHTSNDVLQRIKTL